jgi:hypothetical protein
MTKWPPHGTRKVSQGDDLYFFSSVITLQAGAIKEVEVEQAITGSWKVAMVM